MGADGIGLLLKTRCVATPAMLWETASAIDRPTTSQSAYKFDAFRTRLVEGKDQVKDLACIGEPYKDRVPGVGNLPIEQDPGDPSLDEHARFLVGRGVGLRLPGTGRQ